MHISDSTIYITDGGAFLCGEHLGSTAKHTGRDISGQPIEPVTSELAHACWSIYGYLPVCEQCGKRASLLVALTAQEG